jgi:hypothetical protein
MYGRVATGIVFVCLSSMIPAAHAASTYTCTTFVEAELTDHLTGVSVTGMNDYLQIVGTIQDFQSPNTVFFVDSEGRNLPLSLPSFAAADPNRQIGSVNNAGQVVGSARDETAVPPRTRGFIINADGTYQVIDPPADTPAQTFSDLWASGINDRGEVSGVLMDSNGAVSFVRDSAGFFTIFDDSPSPYDQHAINNRKAVIVGQNLRLPDGSQTPITLHGATSFPMPVFYGINDAGFITGYVQGFGGNVAVVRSPDGNAPAVACPQRRLDIIPYAVNNNGVVVSATHPSPVNSSLVVIATPTGFHSGLQLSNTSWTFSPSPAGQMGGTGTIYITSTGVADLEVLSVIEGARDDTDNPLDFNLTTPFSCVVPLGPGQSCAVSFTFKPTGVGLRTAQLVIYDDAPDAPHVIRLQGMGLGKGRLQFSNQSWNFGEQAVGNTSGPGVIYIYNPGTDVINFSSIALTGMNSPDFTISTNTCGAAIAPYTTCAIGFQFAPQAAGLRSTTLTFSDDSGSRQQTIPLAGAGY